MLFRAFRAVNFFSLYSTQNFLSSGTKKQFLQFVVGIAQKFHSNPVLQRPKRLWAYGQRCPEQNTMESVREESICEGQSTGAHPTLWEREHPNKYGLPCGHAPV